MKCDKKQMKMRCSKLKAKYIDVANSAEIANDGEDTT